MAVKKNVNFSENIKFPFHLKKSRVLPHMVVVAYLEHVEATYRIWFDGLQITILMGEMKNVEKMKAVGKIQKSGNCVHII